MKNMSDDNLMSDLDQSGSIIEKGPANPNKLGGESAGEPKKDSTVDYEKQYEQLEKKLGVQGKELGEYRSFFENVAPLLDKLDKSPELVQAILNNIVDDNLAVAALQGRITVNDAKIINQAHTEVKKELGKKEYEKASVDDISKMVEEKVMEAKKEMESSIKEVEDARSFEQSVTEFIENTPDFANYAAEVETWLDRHPENTDIETAYFAVKGMLSDKEAAKRADIDRAEHGKRLAMNAGGGYSGVNDIPEGVNPADFLIAGKHNPNVF